METKASDSSVEEAVVVDESHEVGEKDEID
jgi:hypothetical protein